MTKGLLKCCAKKSRLYSKYKKTNCALAKNRYLQYLNRLKKILKAAEKNYYSDLFTNASNNLRKTWKIIGTLLCKKPINDVISEISINGSLTTDRLLIANTLNDYFANIGPNLASSIIPPTSTFSDYLKGSHLNSIAIEDTTVMEVINVVNQFDSKSSTGIDDIPMTIIKSSITNIAYPLAQIVNHSLNTGCFPNILKTAKICPIFKSGNKTDAQNYRPISLLPNFSKIFEKIMFNRITSYLDKNSILSSAQYGFRKNLSTYMPLLELFDKITCATDRNEFAIGIFLDLSKAFDTVNHSILIHKLTHYGIRGPAREWLISYLSNRFQYTEIDNVKSDLKPICCGVPQGSILGPLLFLIYINDVTECSLLLKFLLFADDTNAFISGSNIKILQSTLNSELLKLSSWFRANRLSLNVAKSCFVVFGNKYFPSNFDIAIDGTRLPRANTTKFLGVHIDEKLTWKNHIDTISIKVSKAIGAINRIKNIVPYNILLSLYYTTIYTHLCYCIIIWGNACRTTLSKIVILQKRIVRIITHSSYLAHTSPIFRQLHLLKVDDIYKFHVLQFMYKCKMRYLPLSCLNLIRVRNVHSHNTRHISYFELISAKSTLRQKCISFFGPRLWDSLPGSLQSQTLLSNFKKSLTLLLISKY